MTESQKLEEIITLISFLQKYIENNVKASFTNLTFSLETVIKDLLNIFEDKESAFKNINETNRDYPAIDLISEKKSTAIQVTTNADSAKVKKTLKTYSELSLNFKKLIIIGFIKHSKGENPNAKVVGVDYLINLIKHGSHEQKDMAYDILHRQIPLNVLHPSDDRMCLKVVFSMINRSAIRDSSRSEGSYDDMVKGLKELKELITTGRVTGKSIRAKALVEYGFNIQDELSAIEYQVSKIIQICNISKNRSGGQIVCLDVEERTTVDKIKRQIIDKANKLAEKTGLGTEINI